jgi:hypothetical protein
MAKDKIKNWASNQEFAKNFSIPLLHEFEQLRAERAGREEVWKESYKAWSCDGNLSDERNYQGRANLKIPQLRKEVETMSRRLVKAMFPEDYLSAEPAQMSDFDLAVANTQVVRHYFDNIMNLQLKLAPWVKQGVLFGTSPIRTYWCKEEQEIFYRKRVFKENDLGQLIPDLKTVKESQVLYNGPKIQLCDMFQTYVYPYTATDPDQIKRVHFQTKVDYNYLVEKYKAGCCINPDFLWEEGKEQDQEFTETQERLSGFGASGLLYEHHGNRLYDLLEVWGVADLDGKPTPYVCEIINKTHVIRIQQNPYWHQRPNFLFFRFVLPPTTEFYGRGLPEASVPLQAMADDLLNQTMDSTNLSLNSITVVNPAFAPNAESFEVEPRAIWWADPQGVKQFEFPDLSDQGLKNVQVLRSIITEMSDNQPQLPDPIAGKARSTGQAELAINEWQTDLYSFVNQNIKEALEPLAGQVHALLQQNTPDDDIIRISGKYAGSWVNRVMTPSDLAGRYNFKWSGAISVENRAIKTQQMLQFLKIYPMLPPDAQIRIKWSNLMIKLLRDGFNIKDVQNVIETPEMNASVPPWIEDKILEKGGSVKVEDSDEDDLHLRSHAAGLNKAKDAYTRALIQQHMTKHQESKNKKMQMQQQAMLMMQQQQMAQQQEQISGATARRGRPPQNPMAQPAVDNPMGNQSQMSESTSEADLARGIGV